MSANGARRLWSALARRIDSQIKFAKPDNSLGFQIAERSILYRKTL
jgi:hypothetical protein